MKLLAISIGLTILLFAAFIVGIFSQATALTLAAFCAWTPAAWLLGYAACRSGWNPLYVSRGDMGTFRSESTIERVSNGASVPVRNKR